MPAQSVQSDEPLVSVVIPVKGREPLVRAALDSIRAQSHSNWEAVVADDGSAEQTLNMLQRLSAEDSRIRLIQRTALPAGAPACRNRGFKASRGELVIYLDSDDLLAPHCLAQRVRAMAEHPEIQAAIFPSELFDKTPGDLKRYWNAFTPENDLDRILRADTPWQTAGPIWRRAAIERIGGWDESAMSWQDWELAVRFLITGMPYLKVPRPDHHYRLHAPDSIGSGETQCHRLVGIVNQICKSHRLIRQAGQMTEQRHRWLVGLVIEHAEQCIDIARQPLGAIRIANRARKSGVFGFWRWLEGVGYFTARGLGLPVRRYAGRRFAERWLVYRSPTRGKSTAPYVSLAKKG